MRKEYRDKMLALMENEIILVLLKHARDKGRDAWMRTSHIGKAIGTYRKDDPITGELPRYHKNVLLPKLKNEGRVEHSKRIGWRLTESEWNRQNVSK